MLKPTEEELITYIKPILKFEGFKKKGKRWTKVTEHFTYIFFIQGSCYDSHTSPRKPTVCPAEKETAIVDALKHFGYIKEKTSHQ